MKLDSQGLAELEAVVENDIRMLVRFREKNSAIPDMAEKIKKRAFQRYIQQIKAVKTVLVNPTERDAGMEGLRMSLAQSPALLAGFEYLFANYA